MSQDDPNRAESFRVADGGRSSGSSIASLSDATAEDMRNLYKVGNDDSINKLGLPAAGDLLRQDDPFESRGVWENIKDFFGYGSRDQINDKVDALWKNQDPEGFKEYQRQKAQYEAQGLQIGIGLQHKSREEFPALAEHDKRVAQLEKKIQIETLQGMTPEERKQLGQDMAEWQKQNEEHHRRMAEHGARGGTGLFPGPELPESFRRYQDKIREKTDQLTA
jgi:hypothetical protein